MTHRVIRIFVFATLWGVCAWAQAGVIYQYTGDNFDDVQGEITMSDYLTMSIHLDKRLPANSFIADVTTYDGFSFAASAGPLNAIFDADASSLPGYFNTASVTTDAQGNIVYWELIWSLISSPVENDFQVLVVSVGDESGFGFDRYTTLVFNARVVNYTIISEGSLIPTFGDWRTIEVNNPAPLSLLLLSCFALALRSGTRRADAGSKSMSLLRRNI